MNGSHGLADGALPAPASVPFLRGGLAWLVLRPWFDRLALRAITGRYFPLSRAWATAIEARGSPERYRAEGGVTVVTPGRTESVLAMIDERRRALDAANSDWTSAFFDSSEPAAAALVGCEMARVRAAHGLMAARSAFLTVRRQQPAVRWSIAAPDVIAGRHERRLSGKVPAFPPPDAVTVSESHRVESALGREFWLRFPSTVAGVPDTAWAHVYEPASGEAKGTIVFLHGIAMETEMWRPVADPINALVSRGIRVVRPEGPWHGRRRRAGYYGGEPVFAGGVLGFIDFFQAWVGEIAVLTHWARRKESASIAIGGVSLGSLAAQIAATAARDWPNDARPDALFLVVTSGDVVTAALHGGMGTSLGIPQRLAAAGWETADLARWRRLFEPSGSPVVEPDRIVMVLGKADEVTPFEGGQALARTWGVPRANLFIRPAGHFSAALDLYREPAPLERFAALL